MKSRLFRTASCRFAALSAAVFAFSALLISLIVYYAVRGSMEQQLRDYVLAEVSQLLGDYRDHGLEELRHDISERLERAPSPRLHYTVVSPRGVSVFDRLELPAEDGWSRVPRAGTPDLILLTTSLDGGYRFGVAAETRSMVEFGSAFRRTTVLALAVIPLLSVVAGLVVSQRFLARVERLNNTAEQVGRGSLSARIPVAGIGDDFEQLARTINRMLDRIEQLVHNVRCVSVNIAHDLRTPLGRLRRRLEDLVAHQRTAETRDACQSAIELLDETLDTFTSLLRIEELESDANAIRRETIDLSDLLGRLEETYAPIAEDRGQHLRLSAYESAVVNGDRQLLTQLFVNLIENAINHNSEGVQITLLTTSRAGGVEAVVADNGVGVAEELRGDVLKPFYRVGSQGSGLGLSLAARIAALHAASLTLEDNRPGLRVTVSFPAPTG